MDSISQPLSNGLVSLEPANDQNVDLLIAWTHDPIAQGPYKRVPLLDALTLRSLFLTSADRWYFLIRRAADYAPLGRFYYRAWHFHPNPEVIDWELNVFLAVPSERGKGYGTAVQALALHHLLTHPATHSVFAFTLATNVAEQRALAKAGLVKIGTLPHAYYRVPTPQAPSVIYASQAFG